MTEERDDGSGRRLSGQDHPALSVADLDLVYGQRTRALAGVSLHVPEGRIVALLGASGAGKTSVLRAITGLHAFHGGAITRGTVTLEGEDVTGCSPSQTVRRGVAPVLTGRRIFAEMTVDENLRVGAFVPRARRGKDARDRVMDLFPRLAERRASPAGSLPYGEQQMLAIGRALVQEPRLLILDEPSRGLSPLLVRQIRETVVDVARRGTSVLLIEQNAATALSIAHHGYVLEAGRVVREGVAEVLLRDEDVREFHLGLHLEAGRRRSFRDARTYRRRRRWPS